MEQAPIFGHQEEWKAFATRHPEFLRRFPNLKAALDKAYIRPLKDSGKLETMIFFTSRQCVDDFMEILLVCGNAEGNAGEKLLRSFYERVVLVAYLHKHPEKLDAYYEYYHVTQKKLLDAHRRMWPNEKHDPDNVKELEENYERVKENYRTRTCPKCGRKEMGGAWSPVALLDMAEEVGLYRYGYFAYTLPLLQAHPSVKGTIRRLEGDPDRLIGWGERVDRDKADQVLATAHALLLHLFDIQIERFKVDGLEDLARVTAEDYKAIWAPTS